MTKQDVIKAAKLAYYNTDTPVMTDEQYDRLVEEVGEETVGAPILDSLKKIKISDKPMLSLAKCHTAEEIKNFANGQSLVASVKCDGLSVRIIYENGKIVSANSRGDGEIGADITEHIKQFKNVPKSIDYMERFIVDGEAVILQYDFDEINERGQFKNPRNLAAGTLASLDTSLCKTRRMSFIAWDLIEGNKTDHYFNNLSYLASLGFLVAPSFIGKILDEIGYYNQTNKDILKKAKESGIPCDGVVWKYNDINYNTERTAHHFKNAIAWKPAIEEYETELIDIEFSLGRTGQLTPVAIYKDIDTGSAILNRASLHNISEMTAMLGKYPYVGQKIRVFQANEIIPQLSWAESSEEAPRDNKKLIKLLSCPVCGGSLEIKENGGVITAWCANPTCEGKLSQKIVHYCSKKGLDIKGLSIKTIEKLIDKGWLNEISDLYLLHTHKREWKELAGFGEASVSKILNAIEESKNCNLASFISALGIPLIGVNASKEIGKIYSTWEEFKEANNHNWSDLEGFGLEMESSLWAFDYTQADKIAEMLNFTIENDNKEISTSVDGLTFVITGTLSKNRNLIKADIENAGGKVTGSVSGKTSFLVCNDKNSTTGKSARAKELNIPIISEEELYKLFS